MSELELPGTPETPEADFVERVIGVPPDCYAVTDGEDWAIYPKKYCKGAKIIKCRICGAPATNIDPNYPRFNDWNLCDECALEVEVEEEDVNK